MIVNRLPLILKQRGLSIRALSRLTGITYTTIRAVYHSQRRSVQIEVMDALCRVLDIQPADIYKYYPDESATMADDSAIEEEMELIEERPESGSNSSRINRLNENRAGRGWHVW